MPVKPTGIRTAEEAKQLVLERDLSHIKVGVFDLDGVLRGKYMSRSKFFSALESGFNFCDVVLGWDSNDQLYDNVTHTGWHTGYPDASARLLPETCRNLMYEEDGLFFLGEFSGADEAVCPRAQLRKTIDYCRSLGFEPFSALEYEFFVFDETPQSVHDKGFRNLKPWTPGNFGYSVLRNSTQHEFYRELLKCGEVMDFPIEGLHNETGPGVLEVAIGVDKALESADKAALFKTFAKVVAQRSNLMATFMAKWSNSYPGQSGHIHMSLQDSNGKSVFYEDSHPHKMSDTMRHFVAGCQAYMPQMLAMVASTVNSYSRLVPGFWAPTNATWGIENRTVALRLIPGSPKSQRLEYRVAAADANPYLALAAALASGLWGIEEKLEPEAPIQGNGYEAVPPPHLVLPSTLWDAAQNFKASKRARGLFGDAFVDHYAATREWEERELRKTITDWELRRYFEII